VEERVVHYYNVIKGQCACGAAVNHEEKTFSVFPDLVSCPKCLNALTPKEGKSEGKSG